MVDLMEAFQQSWTALAEHYWDDTAKYLLTI